MKINGKRAIALVVATAFAATVAVQGTAQASQTQSGGAAVVLNPGGGVNPDGSDGLVLVVNGAAGLGKTSPNPDFTLEVEEDGSDQLFFAGTPQWCCSTGSGPTLNIGGTLYGNSGAADDSGITPWDSISVVSTGGAAITVPNGDPTYWTSTSTGDATATIRYQITVNSLLYQVDRAITYTYPKNYYDEVWTVTVPQGNTAVVKFYLGGDTAPGSQDSGTSEKNSADGLDSYYVKEPNSDFYVAYIELSANSKFDGAWFATYDEPKPTMIAGGDLGFFVDTTTNPPDAEGYIEGYDVGQYIQWNAGTTPGTITRTLRTEVGFVSVLDAPTGLPPTGSNLVPTYLALALSMMGAVALVASRRRQVTA